MRIDVRYLTPGRQIPTGPFTDALVAQYVKGVKLSLLGDVPTLAEPREDGTRYVLPYSQDDGLAARELLADSPLCLLWRDEKGLKGRVGWWECNLTGTALAEAFAYQPTLAQVLCQARLIVAARAAAERGELEPIIPEED